MGHARAADGLNESFLDDAVLDVERELTCALLGSTPAHTVGETGDVLYLISLDPFALFGDGSRTVVRTLFDNTHILYFLSIIHTRSLLSFCVSRTELLYQKNTSVSITWDKVFEFFALLQSLRAFSVKNYLF